MAAAKSRRGSYRPHNSIYIYAGSFGIEQSLSCFVESVKAHMPEIKAAWDNFWAGLEPIAKPVFEFLKSALKGFGTFASDTFSLVKNAFFGSSDDIRNSWKKLFDDMNDTLSNWADGNVGENSAYFQKNF